MNEIWVLTIKTSLPKACESKADLKLNVSAYESFEVAKQALRKKLNDLAFSSNKMFNGKGGIKEFVKYSKNNIDEPYDEDDEEVLSPSVADSVNEVFLKIFSGEDTNLKKSQNIAPIGALLSKKIRIFSQYTEQMRAPAMDTTLSSIQKTTTDMVATSTST